LPFSSACDTRLIAACLRSLRPPSTTRARFSSMLVSSPEIAPKETNTSTSTPTTMNGTTTSGTSRFL
jgi:hypothetical protein